MITALSPANVVVDSDRREVRNTHEIPLIGDGNKNVGCFMPEKFEEVWKSMGSNVALIHGYSGKQVKYSELLQHVRQLASVFQAEGFRERTQKKGRFYRKPDESETSSKHTYVLILSNNSIEVYVTVFALWLAGCTVILADTSWTFGRIVDILKGRSVNVVVADGASRSLASQLIASPLCTIKRAFYTDDPLSIPAMMTSAHNSGTTTPETSERQNFEGRTTSRLSQSPKSTAVSVLRSIINYHKGPSRCPEDPLFVVFTSATSKEPKPVEVTHFRFLATASTLVDVGLYGKHRHVLVWDPPFELCGILSVCISLLCGARVIIVPERTVPADPKQIAFICRDYKVNSLVGSPDMLNSLLIENLKGNFEDISSVLVLPDGYIPRRNSNILQQIANYFRLEGPQLRVAYGTVETTGPILISSDVRGGPTRGVPLPHVKIRVIFRGGNQIGPERLAGPGEEGELVVSGRSVAHKYWTSQEKAQQDCDNFLSDGWFRTGDYGFYDERGQVTVLGTMEDLVPLPNLFGATKPPRWVHSSLFETFLLQQTGVQDVKVVSVPRGSALPSDIVACIVPESDMDDSQLVEGLRKTIETATYPLNRLQKVYIFDELPRSSWKRRPSRKLILTHILQTTTL